MQFLTDDTAIVKAVDCSEQNAVPQHATMLACIEGCKMEHM